MTSQKPTREQLAYGNLAEITVSDPKYRAVLNEPFGDGQPTLSDEEVQNHMTAQKVADEIIFDTLLENPNAPSGEQHWEMMRRATLSELGAKALGGFEKYFFSLDGKTEPANFTMRDLPAGKSEVVLTNERVVGANRLYTDPIEFLDTALSIIKRQRTISRGNIGPENYATTLKFFADKYSDTSDPMTEGLPQISEETMKALVDECLTGFVDISKKDAPNFVEMTNIYAAVRALPRGMIDKRFTEPILKHSLENLPEYNYMSLGVLLGAISKMDISEHGEDAARTIDLVLRVEKIFETTQDMRVALRAIDALPKSEATDRALTTFFEMQSGLEQPLDLEGTDEMNERLLHIVENVTESPKLTGIAKDVAYASVQRASALCKEKVKMGGLTRSQGDYLKATFDRIVLNFKAI